MVIMGFSCHFGAIQHTTSPYISGWSLGCVWACTTEQRAGILPICHSLGQCQFSKKCPGTGVALYESAIPKCLPSAENFSLHGSGRCMTDNPTPGKIFYRPWTWPVMTYSNWVLPGLDQARQRLFLHCMAMENIACDVDEVFWPDQAERHDAEAKWKITLKVCYAKVFVLWIFLLENLTAFLVIISFIYCNCIIYCNELYLLAYFCLKNENWVLCL